MYLSIDELIVPIPTNLGSRYLSSKLKRRRRRQAAYLESSFQTLDRLPIGLDV